MVYYRHRLGGVGYDEAITKSVGYITRKKNQAAIQVAAWLLIPLLMLMAIAAFGQAPSVVPGISYRAELLRKDGHKVVFNFETRKERGRLIIVLRNGEERIKVTDVRLSHDSIYFNMPTFESYFSARILPGGSLEGIWLKPTEGQPQVFPFYAHAGESYRYKPLRGEARYNISGRWAVDFTKTDKSHRPAVAEWQQTGNKLTGTVLTPTGDYRYLEGIVSGDSLQLSTFDGAHAYYLGAKIEHDGSIVSGLFTAGAGRTETWTAVKDASARLPENSSMALKDDSSRLRFSFPDLTGKMVSINDSKFRNKVVIVQLMGSWCSNCLDETRFLAGYYANNYQRGIEIVALAYEYTTDTARSRKSIDKFRARFNIQYPMLITGVTNWDTLRAEKTLPQLTAINVFPSTIFIGRDGNVKKIHTGFYGPGAPEYYEAFKKEFTETVESLLKE